MSQQRVAMRGEKRQSVRARREGRADGVTEESALSLQLFSKLYAISAGAAGAGFVVQTAAAPWIAERVFQGGVDTVVPAVVQVSQLRNDVSFVPLVFAMLYSMKQASDKGILLSSATYTKLNIGACAYAAIGLATAAALGGFGGDDKLLLGLLKLAMTLPAGITCALALGAAGGGSIAKGISSAVNTVAGDLKTSFFDVRRDSKLSVYFIAQLWITFVVAGSFLLSPTSPVANPPELGGETPALAIIRHCFGSNALFSLCPALFVLQSAAERDRLGASTFRNLALGSGAATFLVTLYTVAIVVGAASTVTATEYDLLPNLVSALLISTLQSLFYVYVGLRK